MSTVHVTKVTKAGQVSIPQSLRRGFCDIGDALAWEQVGDALLVRRVDSPWEGLRRKLRREATRLGLTPEQAQAALEATRRKVFAEQYGE